MVWSVDCALLEVPVLLLPPFMTYCSANCTGSNGNACHQRYVGHLCIICVFLPLPHETCLRGCKDRRAVQYLRVRFCGASTACFSRLVRPLNPVVCTGGIGCDTASVAPCFGSCRLLFQCHMIQLAQHHTVSTFHIPCMYDMSSTYMVALGWPQCSCLFHSHQEGCWLDVDQLMMLIR